MTTMQDVLNDAKEMRNLTFRTATTLHITNSEAESIVMEAICKANESFNHTSGASFRTYIWRVLYHICIDMIRKNSNPLINEADCEFIFSDVEDPTSNTELHAYYREVLDDVKEVINSINNPEHKAIVEEVLLYGNDELPLTARERQIVYRFRQTLKDKYGDIFE